MSYTLVQLPLGLSEVTRTLEPTWEITSQEFVPNFKAALRTTHGTPKDLRNSSSCSTLDKTQYPVRSAEGKKGGAEIHHLALTLRHTFKNIICALFLMVAVFTV